MDARRLLLLLAASVQIAGCYLAHELPVDGSSPDAGRERDAFGRADAPVSRDSSAVDVLAVEPEPDGAVDLPNDAWLADGSVPVGVALTPDAPISIDDTPEHQGGFPDTVWNGTGWGVAFAGARSFLRVLDADGRPIAASVDIAAPWPWAPSIDFAIGRYAIAVGARGSSRLFLFDRSPVLAGMSDALAPATSADVARLSASHHWLMALRSAPQVTVTALDDTLGVAGDPLVLDTFTDGSDAVRVAALKSRAVVGWVTHSALRVAVVGGAPLAQIGATVDVSPLESVTDREDENLALEPMGDEILIGVLTGERAEIWAIDPFTQGLRGPFAAGPTRNTDRRVGIAPVPAHAMYAVCWPRTDGAGGGSAGMHDGVVMRVFGRDGAPLSDELVVVDGLANIGGVDCGWNGTDFVVIWWRAAVDNDLFSQRVHVRFQ